MSQTKLKVNLSNLKKPVSTDEYWNSIMMQDLSQEPLDFNGTELGVMAEINKQQMEHAVARNNSIYNRTEYGGFKSAISHNKNGEKNW